MTVSTTIIKNFHNGNASTTNFAYQFRILEDTDLLVIIRTNSTGAETTKTLSTHYTVAGAGDASGGSITFTSGNVPASGETVVIRRNVPQTQAIDYIANDPFPAETHEEGLDRGTMVAQQVAEESDRSIKLSRTNTMTSTEFTTSATDRANKVLSFDASGEISVAQELGTFKGDSATTTTAAYAVRDIVKGTTTAQLNNIYICIQTSPIGTALTNTAYWTLIVDAVSAATSATAAAASASAASTSATAATNNGAAQVTLATAQVALATTQANNSATSATASASSATASGNSATASANSATAAAASADAFDDIYLGTKSSDPSTDNDGDALAAGMLYFNSTNDILRVYSGSAWQDAALSSTGVVTLTGTQTLTNKTLTSPKINENVAVTSTATELNVLDGITAVVGELNALDIGSTAIGTAVASKAVILDSGKDFTGFRNITTTGNLALGNELYLNSDNSLVTFGASYEIQLTHVHNEGLNLKHTATGDDKPIKLTLQTGETDIAANDVLGAINFQAPNEATGTDAILVAAGIEAVSEGDFSSSSNATKLSFKTAASEAASEKMSLSSAGALTINSAYTFPTADGSADQVLKTNGSGALSFAAAASGGGKILQVVAATDTAARTTTSASYTKASNSCDVAITPSASNSKVLIMLSSGGGVTASGVRGTFTFFRDSTDLGGGDGVRTFENAGATSSEIPYVVYFLDTPNTTSQVTYSIQMKVQGGGTLYFGQKGISTMTCMEIGA